MSTIYVIYTCITKAMIRVHSKIVHVHNVHQCVKCNGNAQNLETQSVQGNFWALLQTGGYTMSSTSAKICQPVYNDCDYISLAACAHLDSTIQTLTPHEHCCQCSMSRNLCWHAPSAASCGIMLAVLHCQLGGTVLQELPVNHLSGLIALQNGLLHACVM